MGHEVIFKRESEGFSRSPGPETMNVHFTEAEQKKIIEILRTKGKPPPCPRCGVRMNRQAIPPRTEVAYVRERIWLVCGGCRTSVVLDRRKVERGNTEGGR